ncbi:MAG TPA: bifunctional enoyl-CoA hydratase/phosphate acetyltransferase [Stellaceae bacterium]|nr:bifunctional enoyl-CoA hydratase/phosphate acetyltransferase [Stellaceae bacterium]
MNSGETITNRTFDELEIGESASMSKTITRDDAALMALLSGSPILSAAEPSIAPLTPSIWAGTLAAAVLSAKLPGPGTIYLGESLRFHREIELGDVLTTKVIVREKHSAGGTVVFDCESSDANGERVLSGTVEVIAPRVKFTGRAGAAPEIRVRRHDKYDMLIARCRGLAPVATAVAHPCDESSLRAALDAAKAGIVEPILIGPSGKIAAVAAKEKLDLADYEIVDAPHSHAAAEKAVELVRLGKAELLMKGSLHTDELLAAVVKRETGLRTARRISHCFILDVPTYPKPLVITDAAVNIYPTLEDKVDIVQNAIDLVRALGLDRPLVAILSAVETVNEKIRSTLDAAALCKMADRGQIVGAAIDGPLALDNAISKAAAQIKGIRSPVAGQADILVVPDLEAGNMVYKNLNFLADAEGAGVVLGARVPIILTSRADSVRSRLASCAVAALYARARHATIASAAE